MIGEILTWVGVGIAALATYALYRSAERSNVAADPEDAREGRSSAGATRTARRR